MRNGYPHRVGISIHALLAESDLSTILTTTYLLISIHALLAESDVVDCGGFGAKIKFLSTLSLRRATLKRQEEQRKFDISIHALLAESDRRSEGACCHRPRFLSTLSLRRATFRTPRRSKWGTHFYPRSPCGERRLLQNGFLDVAAISIHALLAESDPK